MPLDLAIRKWGARLLSFVGKNRDTGREAENTFTTVFTLPDGRKLTTEDLRGLSGRMNVREGKLLEVTGTVRCEVIGRLTVPREAETLHQQAREAGGHGDYQRAIALLEQASELAPDWPYPVYDRAYTQCS